MSEKTFECKTLRIPILESNFQSVRVENYTLFVLFNSYTRTNFIHIGYQLEIYFDSDSHKFMLECSYDV